MTAICIPIFIQPHIDLEDSLAAAEQALAGTDGMIELRCDQASAAQMAEAIELARLPVIVTVRSRAEGGLCDKSDPQRLALWLRAMEEGADYIDVELETWEKNPDIRRQIEETAEKTGAALILSHHHFPGRPADLPQRLARLQSVKAARIHKLVWTADSILDAIEALEMTRRASTNDRPLVALAMGEEGLISRLLAKKAGAPFTFAALAHGKQSAPGQPTAAELLTRYRWNTQTADTPLFGVAGWPIAHSLSPHIHNAGFEAVHAPGVYVPLAIRPGYDSFAAAINALRSHLDLQGLSITIPHKENAHRFVLGSNEPGAFNTIIWKENRPIGLNTDYGAALDALVAAWNGKREDVAGKQIAVLGAGGAARAIVAALAAHGATVVIYNRTFDRAAALAAEFDGKTGKVVPAPWNKLPDSCCQAYINCTPLGMSPHIQSSPLDFDPNWSPDTVIFDTVYNPPLTQFLKTAQSKGARIVPGSEMFIRQAAAQFVEFTAKQPPLHIFRQILTQELATSPQPKPAVSDAGAN